MTTYTPAFTQKCAEWLSKEFGNDFSRVCLLLPNFHAASLLKNALSELPLKNGLLPGIMLPDEMVCRLSGLEIADDFELLFPLYEQYLEQEGHQSLEQFFASGMTMLSDYSDIDMGLVDSKPFFHELYALKSLNVFEPGVEENATARAYLHFWDKYRALYGELHKLMPEWGKAYKGFVYRSAATGPWPENWISAGTRFVAIGFSNLGKAEEKLFDRLLESYSLSLLPDYDIYYCHDPLHEAGMFFRKYLNRWPVPEEFAPSKGIGSRNLEVEAIGINGKSGQAAVLADLLSEPDFSPADTLLVMADDKNLPFLLRQIPEAAGIPDLSMNFPLRDSLSSDFIHLWLRLQQETREGGSKGIQFYTRPLLRLISHPFFKMYFGDLGEKEAAGWRSRNLLFISPDELIRRFGADAALWFRPCTDALSLHEGMSDLLKSLMPRLEKEEAKWDLPESACMAQVLQFLDSLAPWMQQLSGAGVSAAACMAWIRDFIQSARLPYESEAGKGLQVCGLYETRLSHARRVIVIGAAEGMLPAAKGANSYLPLELRNAWLPGHREKDATVSYLFYRMLHQAEQLYLLYPTGGEGGEKNEKSRFILQIREELCKQRSAISFRERLLALPLPVRSAQEQSEDRLPKNQMIMDRLLELGKGKGFSPSALNSAVACSMQFYLHYIARLRESDELEEVVGSDVMGTAVHYALEEAYKPMIGQEVNEAELSKMLEDPDFPLPLIKKCMSESFTEEALESGQNYLLMKLSAKMARRFVEADLEAVQTSGPYLLRMLEQRLEREVETRFGKIRISGITDRVEFREGQLRIADYKTGKMSSKFAKEKSELYFSDPGYAKATQVAAYAWMLGDSKEEINSGIYWLRHPEKGFDGIAMSKEAIAAFDLELVKFCNDLLDPEIPFTKTEDRNICQWCAFRDWCGR